jgi:hypothetical protein
MPEDGISGHGTPVPDPKRLELVGDLLALGVLIL